MSRLDLLRRSAVWTAATRLWTGVSALFARSTATDDGREARLTTIRSSRLWAFLSRAPAPRFVTIGPEDSRAFGAATRLAQRVGLGGTPSRGRWTEAVGPYPNRVLGLVTGALAAGQCAGQPSGDPTAAVAVWAGVLVASALAVVPRVSWQRFWSTATGRLVRAACIAPVDDER